MLWPPSTSHYCTPKPSFRHDGDDDDDVMFGLGDNGDHRGAQTTTIKTAANHLLVSPLVLENEEFTFRDLIYSNYKEKI